MGIQSTEKAEQEPGLRGGQRRGVGGAGPGAVVGAGPAGGQLLPLPITKSGSQGTRGVQDEKEQGERKR